MEKITQSYQTIIALFGIFFAFSFLANAQVQQNFTPRFSETINGDVVIIANNMLSRTATTDYNGEDGNHDFSDNVYVDIDTDATTFNSSSANFVNPEPQVVCLNIIKTYLYWAAGDKEKDNGDDNQPNWNYNDIKLMLPGENIYTTLTADEVIYRGRDVHFSNDPYVCIKDITSLVTSLTSPYGKYQVANVEAKNGDLFSHTLGSHPGTSGGWQIVYVYESPELTTKNISLFDGYAHVSKTENNFDIDFNGFQTVPIGPVNAKIVIGALEGDRDLSGDKLQIRNTANTFVDLTAPLRTADNFFNSRITVGNTNFTNRNPASLNTLGFDASVFQLDNAGNSIIDNNQTSATLRLTSDQEVYGLYLIGLSVDVWAPNLYPIKLKSDAENDITEAGNTVIFDFNFSNTGNDDAINVMLSTTLPTNLEFVSANNLPNGVTYSYNINTRFLQFFVEDGLVDVGDAPLNLQFEVQIKEECYFLEDSCDLSFEIQLLATYNGVENPAPQSTLSSNDLDECQLGTVLPITIIQPDAAVWANPPEDLNRNFNCENISNLGNAQSLFPDTDKCTFALTKTSGPFVPNVGCGSSGTYTNTWTFTDACGRTIADYVQVITIVDDTPPVFEALPNDSTIECVQGSNFTQPTVTDSCSATINLSFQDITTNGSCDGDYSVTRTWTATDECGNTSTASQTVFIQDTTPPNLDTSVEPEITLICSVVPEIPTLEFSDSCSANVTVIYEEEEQIIDDENYDIIRNWTAFDDCANDTKFTQIVHMQANNSINRIPLNMCANDFSIDLNNYVDVDNNGYWESDDLNVLNNTELDPVNLSQGEYVFNYISSVNQCVQITELTITIGEICQELEPCIKSIFDVEISKLVTPNGDLKNQTFNVAYVSNPDVDVRTNCDIIITVKMFNRWGTKVFESRDYNNDWTGTSGGRIGTEIELPTGTYYYVVTLENSGLKPIQGYILLGTDQ